MLDARRIRVGAWELHHHVLKPSRCLLQRHCKHLLAAASNPDIVTFHLTGQPPTVSPPPTPATESVAIHRAVLVAAGGPLCALVSGPFQEARANHITIHENLDCFSVVRDFLNCQPINMTSLPRDMPLVADRWGLTTLFEACFAHAEERAQAHGEAPRLSAADLIRTYVPVMSVVRVPERFAKYLALRMALEMEEVNADFEERAEGDSLDDACCELHADGVACRRRRRERAEMEKERERKEEAKRKAIEGKKEEGRAAESGACEKDDEQDLPASTITEAQAHSLSTNPAASSLDEKAGKRANDRQVNGAVESEAKTAVIDSATGMAVAGNSSSAQQCSHGSDLAEAGSTANAASKSVPFRADDSEAKSAVVGDATAPPAVRDEDRVGKGLGNDDGNTAEKTGSSELASASTAAAETTGEASAQIDESNEVANTHVSSADEALVTAESASQIDDTRADSPTTASADALSSSSAVTGSSSVQPVASTSPSERRSGGSTVSVSAAAGSENLGITVDSTRVDQEIVEQSAAEKSTAYTSEAGALPGASAANEGDSAADASSGIGSDTSLTARAPGTDSPCEENAAVDASSASGSGQVGASEPSQTGNLGEGSVIADASSATNSTQGGTVGSSGNGAPGEGNPTANGSSDIDSGQAGTAEGGNDDVEISEVGGGPDAAAAVENTAGGDGSGDDATNDDADAEGASVSGSEVDSVPAISSLTKFPQETPTLEAQTYDWHKNFDIWRIFASQKMMQHVVHYLSFYAREDYSPLLLDVIMRQLEPTLEDAEIIKLLRELDWEWAAPDGAILESESTKQWSARAWRLLVIAQVGYVDSGVDFRMVWRYDDLFRDLQERAAALSDKSSNSGSDTQSNTSDDANEMGFQKHWDGIAERDGFRFTMSIQCGDPGPADVDPLLMRVKLVESEDLPLDKKDGQREAAVRIKVVESGCGCDVHKGEGFQGATASPARLGEQRNDNLKDFKGDGLSFEIVEREELKKLMETHTTSCGLVFQVRLYVYPLQNRDGLSKRHLEDKPAGCLCGHCDCEECGIHEETQVSQGEPVTTG